MVKLSGKGFSIWIVGSSLVRNAFVHARSRTGGVHLGLQRIGVHIWWQGYSGMVLKDLEPTIKNVLKYEEPPNYIVIHVAGNDLGRIKVVFLRNNIKNTLKRIQTYLPSTIIVWSQILPRKTWRYSDSCESMLKCKDRINSAISAFVIKKGGAV